MVTSAVCLLRRGPECMYVYVCMVGFGIFQLYAAVDSWKMYVGNCRHERCMLANKWDRVCVCLGTNEGVSMW